MKFVVIIDGQNYLLEVMLSFVFIEVLFVIYDIFIYVFVIVKFLNEIQFSLCVDDFIKLNDIWMLNKFYVLNFFEKVSVSNFVQFSFVNYFYSYVFVCKDMCCNFDYSKMFVF